MDKTFGGASTPAPCFRNLPDDPSAERTLMVIGQPRGGTSVVAAVADGVGIYMGPQGELRSGGSFESFVFTHGNSRQRLEEVRRCNSQYTVWGWKQPFGISAMCPMLPRIRNPYLVFVFRDVMATTQSYMRHANELFEAAAKRVLGMNNELFMEAWSTELPSFLVSYDRLKTQPTAFVDAMVEFLGIHPTEQQRIEAVQRISFRGGYVKMPKEYGYPPAPPPHTTLEKWPKE